MTVDAGTPGGKSPKLSLPPKTSKSALASHNVWRESRDLFEYAQGATTFACPLPLQYLSRQGENSHMCVPVFVWNFDSLLNAS